MPERIVALADEASKLANRKVAEIQRINASTRLLALNAQIEATHAGTVGAGFEVVAKEVKNISLAIDVLADELSGQLRPRLLELNRLGSELVVTVRGKRLADLALNMIEIVDRNLYERSCDVRWWATDSALVDACTRQHVEQRTHASRRLGVILDSYTVYSELVLCDPRGNVIAHGRPGQFPALLGASLAHEPWFRSALGAANGGEFVAGEVGAAPYLAGRVVAPYATAVRAGGELHGTPIGVLGVLFDWERQADSVVQGVRLSPDERAYTRALIVDARHRVLAASDGPGALGQAFSLAVEGRTIGHYVADDASVVGFALTPGYETYRGLGWYGVIVQHPPRP